MSRNHLVNICQYGTDGFGHQLEGILRLVSLSLNKKANYQYKPRTHFEFEHNVDANQLATYLLKAFSILSNIDNSFEIIPCNVFQNAGDFYKIAQNKGYRDNIYLYDGVGHGRELPPNFEMPWEITPSLPSLQEAFVKGNPFLPPPSYNSGEGICLCCHIRLGDAVGTRILETESIFDVIRKFQQIPEITIIIHSDGDVEHLRSPNTTLYGSGTNVLQVLSDFINADILLINYSSLSIAGHLLANSTQKVICPDNAGVTFHRRILDKCVRISQLDIPLLISSIC